MAVENLEGITTDSDSGEDVDGDLDDEDSDDVMLDDHVMLHKLLQRCNCSFSTTYSVFLVTMLVVDL